MTGLASKFHVINCLNGGIGLAVPKVKGVSQKKSSPETSA